MNTKRIFEGESPFRMRLGSRARTLHLLRNAAFLSALMGGFGCGDHDELPDMTKQAVKIDEVPENLRSVATKAIPGVNLNEAWKNLDRQGKLHSYEIRGKNAADGKTREVRVSLTGEVLESE